MRAWLRTISPRLELRGGDQIWSRYLLFQQELPATARAMGLAIEQMTFLDLVIAVEDWLQRNP